MKIESGMSGHWTDEQIISHLYGVGPENNHLASCNQCKERAAAFDSGRRTLESAFAPGDEVTADFLAAQRRAIYARVGRRTSWWAGASVRHWASAAATVLVLGGGLFIYEENHSHQAPAGAKVTDAQLAQEMSQLSQSVEPEPGAPLQALFDE